MSINKSVRAARCNVRIYTQSFQVANIYQSNGFLRVKDVSHELELCLVFDKPDDDATPWQPALLSKDGNIIVLDQQDFSEFPTPPSGETVKYDYVYHSGCDRQDPHCLKDTCIKKAGLPKTRNDPRYLPIGKTLTDLRYSGFPTRSSSLKRRSISSSRTSSQSPIRTEGSLDTEIPHVIPVSEGRQIINSFREDVWRQSGHGCAVTREGDLDGLICPGFEAAHIIPQSQWMVFPMSDNQDIADPANDNSLVYAWKATWSPNTNGIMLDSTLHKCFDQRLWSIHPETRKFRAFIDSPYLNKFHGQTVILSKEIENKPLQYHYDMCIFENTVAPDVPTPLKLSDIPPLPPRAKFLKTHDGDPSKQASNLGTPSFPGAPSFPGGSPSGLPSSGEKAFFPPSHQATARALSPPPSEPGSEERTLWPFDKDTMQVPTAQLVEDISDDDEHSRGRTLKRKRCTSSESDGDQVPLGDEVA